MLQSRQRWCDIRIRPIEFFDLPDLISKRNQIIALNSSLSLTRSTLLGFSTFFDYFNPERGVYTIILEDDKRARAAMGQLRTRLGERSASLSYLLTRTELNNPILIELLEGLVRKAGDWGVFNLTAEIDAHSQLLEPLSRAGFKVYAQEHVYQYRSLNQPVSSAPRPTWTVSGSKHEISINSLYHAALPPQVQAAEPFPSEGLHGMVYCEDNMVKAYAEPVYGSRGIFLRFIIHPDLTDLSEILPPLLEQFDPLLTRPIYLAARHYQPSLNSFLQQYFQPALPTKTILVRYLTQMIRNPALNARRTLLENTSAEPTTSIVRSQREGV